MYAILFIIVLLFSAAGIAAIIRESTHLFKRKKRMFMYFEWRAKGQTGTSREYGPMEEIDAVGAMTYRQSLGAEIVFRAMEDSQEKIEDIIDERYRHHLALENTQRNRR